MSRIPSKISTINIHKNHKISLTPTSSPATWQKHSNPPIWTTPLSLNQQKFVFVQEVTSTFLYYTRAVNVTMLTALGSIATQQANTTKNTMKKFTQFLDYPPSHPDAIITYNARNMVLLGHSDASYILETKARSKVSGNFFMSNNSAIPPNNGAVITIAQIIKAVMYSAEEVELVPFSSNDVKPSRNATHYKKWPTNNRPH